MIINQNESNKSNSIYIVFITLLFFCLGFSGILNHELWLDEAHHFLLSRDSANISALIYNARYEGHPLLWNFILFLITRFSHDVIYMQLLHVCISTAAAFLFLRYAPFGLKINSFFIFSYFFFYEYTVISRNYGLSLLLLIIICILFSRAQINFPLTAFMIVLLANTHLFSTIISVALSLVLFFLLFKGKEGKVMAVLCGVLIIGGLILAFYSILPPPDHFLKTYDTDSYFSFKRYGKAASIVMKGLLHFPDISSYHSWNTNLLISISKKAAIIPVVIFLFIPLILFIDKPMSLFVFYFSTIGLMFFIFVSPVIVGVRHCGFVFLYFTVSLWLEKSILQKPLYNFTLLFRLKKIIATPFLYIVLGIQVLAAIFTYVKDLRHPFSEGKAVALYLKTNHLENSVLAVSSHYSGPPICCYLDKKMFYIENNSFQSFCLWNTHPYEITKSVMLDRLNRLRQNTAGDQKIILILNYTLADTFVKSEMKSVYPGMQLTFLKQFDKSMVRSENYFLYEVDSK